MYVLHHLGLYLSANADRISGTPSSKISAQILDEEWVFCNQQGSGLCELSTIPSYWVVMDGDVQSYLDSDLYVEIEQHHVMFRRSAIRCFLHGPDITLSNSLDYKRYFPEFNFTINNLTVTVENDIYLKITYGGVSKIKNIGEIKFKEYLLLMQALFCWQSNAEMGILDKMVYVDPDNNALGHALGVFSILKRIRSGFMLRQVPRKGELMRVFVAGDIKIDESYYIKKKTLIHANSVAFNNHELRLRCFAYIQSYEITNLDYFCARAISLKNARQPGSKRYLTIKNSLWKKVMFDLNLFLKADNQDLILNVDEKRYKISEKAKDFLLTVNVVKPLFVPLLLNKPTEEKVLKRPYFNKSLFTKICRRSKKETLPEQILHIKEKMGEMYKRMSILSNNDNHGFMRRFKDPKVFISEVDRPRYEEYFTVKYRYDCYKQVYGFLNKYGLDEGAHVGVCQKRKENLYKSTEDVIIKSGFKRSVVNPIIHSDFQVSYVDVVKKGIEKSKMVTSTKNYKDSLLLAKTLKLKMDTVVKMRGKINELSGKSYVTEGYITVEEDPQLWVHEIEKRLKKFHSGKMGLDKFLKDVYKFKTGFINELTLKQKMRYVHYCEDKKEPSFDKEGFNNDYNDLLSLHKNLESVRDTIKLKNHFKVLSDLKESTEVLKDDDDRMFMMNNTLVNKSLQQNERFHYLLMKRDSKYRESVTKSDDALDSDEIDSGDKSKNKKVDEYFIRRKGVKKMLKTSAVLNIDCSGRINNIKIADSNYLNLKTDILKDTKIDYYEKISKIVEYKNSRSKGKFNSDFGFRPGVALSEKMGKGFKFSKYDSLEESLSCYRIHDVQLGVLKLEREIELVLPLSDLLLKSMAFRHGP